MQDQKKRKAASVAAEERARKHTQGRGNQSLMLGILALVSGYLWVGQPAFLESKPLDPISVELSEASLRMEMTIFITKIVKFQADSLRLPRSLAEAWEERPGFLYVVEGGGFSLTGNEGPISLHYESTQDVVEFMGDALRVVGGTQ